MKLKRVALGFIIVFLVVALVLAPCVYATTIFSAVNITSIHTCPLDSHTFVIAYHDEDNDDFSFQIYDTNGTQVLAETDVDDTSGGSLQQKGIGVSAFNSTTFVIGWNDRGAGTANFAIYNKTGSLLAGPTTADNAVGNSFGVSVSTFNSTYFVIAWADKVDKDATFSVYEAGNATAKSGPTDADTDIASASPISVSTFNSTYFVIGWLDYTDGDATFAVYTSSSALIAGPTDADTTAGYPYTISVSTFNSTTFVIGWYDETFADRDATFAVYSSAGVLLTGPTDADTAVGGDCYSVQVSALNSTAFVISWYDSVDFDLTFATYLSDGTAVCAATDIESWPVAANAPFMYQSPCSQETATNIKLSLDNWIIAYANTTTQAIWRAYKPDGSTWDGSFQTLLTVYVSASQTFHANQQAFWAFTKYMSSSQTFTTGILPVGLGVFGSANQTFATLSQNWYNWMLGAGSASQFHAYGTGKGWWFIPPVVTPGRDPLIYVAIGFGLVALGIAADFKRRKKP